MKKRGLSVFLLLAILLTGLIPGSIVFAAEDELRNVSKGCSYTAPQPYIQDAANYEPNNYRHKNYKELTDGVYGSSTGGAEWYAFWGASKYDVTVDLGKVYTDIARVAVQVGKKDDWGIVLPKSITVSGSADNKNFTPLGTLKDTASDSGQAYHTYEADVTGEYRYIRFEITSSGTFTFVSEVEVFCGYLSSFGVKEGYGWYLEDGAMYGVSEKTDVSALSDIVNTMAGVKLTTADGKEKVSGNLATGDIITKYDQTGNTVLQTYTVVIDGDVSADGKINISDYVLLKRYVMLTYTLDSVQLLAADADRSGKINVADYSLVKRHALSTHNLYEKYEPEVEKDGRGDVTEEFKKMDTTDNIDTLTSHEMTLKRNSATEYGITCQTEGGSLYLTLHKTSWGTFNLGKWEFTEKGTTHRFVSDSTDWEYVYRVGKKKGEWQWSGGNHDNEQMVSLKLYDGKTNKEITLAVGQSVSLQNLKIVETTQLYWGDAANGYSEDEHYANAVRTYTIVGPQITLAVDYEYLKDAYYGISYTCMFPINKKYGLYCAFLDGEELLSVVETLKVGAADYSGKQYDGNAADRCIMWGYDGMEKYKFDVRVLTPETSCNNYDNNMQVSFWDMNTTSNKLYFSKWDSRDKDVVKAGSTIHTECRWTFYIDD